MASLGGNITTRHNLVGLKRSLASAVIGAGLRTICGLQSPSIWWCFRQPNFSVGYATQRLGGRSAGYFSSSWKRWTAAEESRLLALRAKGVKFEDLQTLFPGRQLRALEARVHLLKTRSPRSLVKSSNQPWTAPQMSLLSEMRQRGLSFEWIATNLPGRTPAAVADMWYESGKHPCPNDGRPRWRSWPQRQQDQVLEKKVSGMSLDEISSAVGLEPSEINAFIKYNLRRHPDPKVRAAMMSAAYYTPEEDALIVELRNRKICVKDMLQYLPGRSHRSLRGRIESLRHRMNPEVVIKHRPAHEIAMVRQISEDCCESGTPWLRAWPLIHERVPGYPRRSAYCLFWRMLKRREDSDGQ